MVRSRNALLNGAKRYLLGKEREVLGAISLILLAGILYAGLKPFHAPANGVRWIPNSHGVEFVGAGTILSAANWALPVAGRTLEIEIQPEERRDGDAIAGFYDASAKRVLVLRQDEYDLELLSESTDAWHRSRASNLVLPVVLAAGKSTFWAVSSDTAVTAVYRDGLLIKRSANFRISAEEFSGQLVLGTMPNSNNDWVGKILGLAVFDQALSGQRIRQHHDNWRRDGKPDIIDADACRALYVFDEHIGNTVHNRCRPADGLHIPETYVLLHPTTLDPIWHAFAWKPWFFEDVAINVAGFVPLGFFLCGWFLACEFRKAAIYAALAGTAVSLLIELTQTQLPTRNSSMCDLITNAAGSILGTALYMKYGSQIWHRGKNPTRDSHLS